MRLYHLALVPVLTTAMLGAVACKEEGGARSKSNIYTYEMSGVHSNGARKKIGARYVYGSRAARMSSNSGTVKTKVTTAGPKKVTINVTANGSSVKCTIVIKSNGDRVATVTNSGRNTATCTFTP